MGTWQDIKESVLGKLEDTVEQVANPESLIDEIFPTN